MGELRMGYHRTLGEIDDRVAQMFALVTEAVAAADYAFLSGDDAVAAVLREREPMMDALHREVDHLVTTQLALQAPMSHELRFLLAVLRIVPELERTADLANHIAARGAQHLADELTPRARGLIAEMGQLTERMWRATADAYSARDVTAATRIDALDDCVDDLHASLLVELVGAGLRAPVLLEMGLVARFLERLGDHAVNVARRFQELGGFRVRAVPPAASG